MDIVGVAVLAGDIDSVRTHVLKNRVSVRVRDNVGMHAPEYWGLHFRFKFRVRDRCSFKYSIIEIRFGIRVRVSYKGSTGVPVLEYWGSLFRVRDCELQVYKYWCLCFRVRIRVRFGVRDSVEMQVPEYWSFSF